VGFGIAVLDLVAVPTIFGVTTSGGLYVYVNDVTGLAYIGWLLIVGISMMRVKPEAVVSATAYGG